MLVVAMYIYIIYMICVNDGNWVRRMEIRPSHYGHAVYKTGLAVALLAYIEKLRRACF
jgi:hypothetical protein